MTDHRYDSYKWMTTKRLQGRSLEIPRFPGSIRCKTSLPIGRLVDQRAPDAMDRDVEKIKPSLLRRQAVTQPGDRLYDERIRGIGFDLAP